MKGILKGLGFSILFAVVAYVSFLLGSVVGSYAGLKWLGFILIIPGVIFVLPALPLLFLIDILPMAYFFPTGGASGVFGSLIVFSIILWSVLFAILLLFGIWPFKPHNNALNKLST